MKASPAQDPFMSELTIGLVPHSNDSSRHRSVAAVFVVGLVIIAIIAATVAVVVSSNNESSVNANEVADEDKYATAYFLEDGESMCNDGTPGLYYVRRSPTQQHLDRWIIRFKGPSYCYDNEGCNFRASTMYRQTSSNSMPLTDLIDFAKAGAGEGVPGGILLCDEEENPLFWDDNHIQMHYCSSDLWTGAAPEPMWPGTMDKLPQGAYFRGQTILRNGITAIAEEHGMKENCSSAIMLFEGMSAAGAFSNADWIYNYFQTNIPQCRLHIVIDGGWFPDMPCFSEPYPEFIPFPTELAAGYDVWGGTGGGANIVSSPCSASGLTWECFLAKYVVDFLPKNIQLGFFFNLFNKLAVTEQYGIYDEWYWNTTETKEYITEWAVTILDEITSTARYAEHLAGTSNDAYWISMCQQDDDFSNYGMYDIYLDDGADGFSPADGLYQWVDLQESLAEYNDCGWYPNCEPNDGCAFHNDPELMMSEPDPEDPNLLCEDAPEAKTPTLN